MVLDKVIEIIVSQLEIEKSEIYADATFDKLGVDSLDLFRIIIEIEEAFNIRIENTDNIKRVQDLVDYIEANK